MRHVEERWFAAHDGVKLFYRHWPSERGKKTAPIAIVLLHRGHEHSGRVDHIVYELSLPQHDFFAFDARAHGKSEGEQGSGTTMSTFVQDLDDFVRHIRAEYGLAEENIAVVAQSMGAVIAAAWTHDYAPRIRCLVLAAPAFKVKLYVPFARLGLAFWHALNGDFFVQSYVKGSALTQDAARVASYAADPLIKRPISVRVLLSLYQMAARVIEDAAAIRVPVQLLLSGRDWVVDNKPQERFYERVGTAEKEIHVFDGFLHDTLGERDRHLPLAKARAFLVQQFAHPLRRPSLIDADRSGFTRREFDELSKPLPPWSLKNLIFGATKIFMRTIGRALSDGIRLGVETGFDSGASLDYVYRNRPSGLTPIGRLIDWFYLNAVGWRGIRVRKEMIGELIGRAAAAVERDGMGVRFLDVAAGYGRYALEGILSSGIKPDEILLRDVDAGNVARGRELIATTNLPARFEQGNAFDIKSFETLSRNFTIGIVSGLYELFPDNRYVRESLACLADAIAPGGYLIYTGQPWHPQIEMIARTLSSHLGGSRWVMRRRTQEELDELVRAAGFVKVAQRVDPTGIFTVSIAQRT